MRDFRLHTCR